MRPIQAEVQESGQLPLRNFLGDDAASSSIPLVPKLNAFPPSVLTMTGQQLGLFLPAKSLDLPGSDVSLMKQSLDPTGNSEPNHAGGKEQSHPVDGLANPQKLDQPESGNSSSKTWSVLSRTDHLDAEEVSSEEIVSGHPKSDTDP
ncbi:hypothetical protein ACJRO7_006808 [Eucalyptus globulus]|uniref:Uncharacterized protein n=1 Tax=Eucalyptus globulus TaxID=34317 RepID=A0ABD3ILR3_EUCGL